MTPRGGGHSCPLYPAIGSRVSERSTGTCERGTNENTNGLLCQYVPKGASMAHLAQRGCARLAVKLVRRPRKRLGYRTPEECYAR